MRAIAVTIGLVGALLIHGVGAASPGCEDAWKTASAIPDATPPAARIAQLKELVAQCPDDWRLHNNLGVAYEDSADIENALAEYRRATELDNRAAEPYHGLGDIEFRRRACPKAIGYYTEFLARAGVKVPVERAEKNIAECRKRLGGITPAEEIVARMNPRTRGLPRSIHVEVGTVEFHSDTILFDLDSAKIRAESARQIQEMAKGLAQPEMQGTRWIVEGHTDDLGTDEYNQGLSRQRAENVRAALERELGGQKVDLRAVGYGKSHPKVTGTSEQMRAQNRRVELKVEQ